MKNSKDNKKRLNEMSPELLNRAAAKQRKLLKNKGYLQKISAWQYIKSMKRADDFEAYAKQIAAAINAGNEGTPNQKAVDIDTVPTDAEVFANVPETSSASATSTSTGGAVSKKARKKEIKKIRQQTGAPLKRVRTKMPNLSGNNAYKPGIYVIRYISSLDDDVCSIWEEATSIEDAINLALQDFWDMKEIIDCYFETANTNAYSSDDAVVPVAGSSTTTSSSSKVSQSDIIGNSVIDVNDYSSSAEVADAIASQMSDGNFEDAEEFFADAKIDEITEECADEPIYEGLDINGNEWSGVKSSYRRVLDNESNGEYTSDKDYDVLIVTDVITEADGSANDQMISGKFNRDAFRATLRNGVVHFMFMKKDGSERQAMGTTNATILDKHGVASLQSSGRAEYPSVVTYYDMESGAWRSFRNDSIRIIYDESYQ